MGQATGMLLRERIIELRQANYTFYLIMPRCYNIKIIPPYIEDLILPKNNKIG
jgi:hypothetical protein